MHFLGHPVCIILTNGMSDVLQRSLDVISETYLSAGLMINATKMEILSAPSPDAPTFSNSGNQLKFLKILLSWVQISHFLVTSQMRSKDALILLHQPLSCLSKRVFGNQNLTIHTKIVVYYAVVISTI